MATPSRKYPPLADLIDNFTKAACGISRSDAIKTDICVICKGSAIEFRDVCSFREYRISGMCQKCQDDTFEGGDE